MDSGPGFASFLSLLYHDLQAAQPGTEGFRHVRPKDRISIVRIDRGVQDRTSARDGRPVLDEIRDQLLQLVDAIRLFVHTQQPAVPGSLPGIIERLGGEPTTPEEKKKKIELFAASSLSEEEAYFHLDPAMSYVP